MSFCCTIYSSQAKLLLWRLLYTYFPGCIVPDNPIYSLLCGSTLAYLSGLHSVKWWIQRYCYVIVILLYYPLQSGGCTDPNCSSLSVCSSPPADNAIPIKSWFSDPHDTALLNLLPVLDALRFTTDVRSVLSRNLHLNCMHWPYSCMVRFSIKAWYSILLLFRTQVWTKFGLLQSFMDGMYICAYWRELLGFA